MTNKKQIKEFIAENIDYQQVIPMLIKSIGYKFTQYSREIGKSSRYIDTKLNDPNASPLKLNDFKRFQLFFEKKFPETTFEDWVYSQVINNNRAWNKTKLLNDNLKLKEEIALLNKKISELESPQYDDNSEETTQGESRVPSPQELVIKENEL